MAWHIGSVVTETSSTNTSLSFCNSGAPDSLWPNIPNIGMGLLVNCRNEYSRNGVSNDQYHIPRTCVSNAFHTTKHRIQEHDSGCNQIPASLLTSKKRENTLHRHLTDHAGHRGQNHTTLPSGAINAKTLTDKVRYSKLTEFTQVRRKQHRQDDVATGPTH